MRLNGFSIFWVASRMNPISRANHLWKSIQSGGRALTVRNIYATTHCCLFALGSTNFWASPQHQCVCVCVSGCLVVCVRAFVFVCWWVRKVNDFPAELKPKTPAEIGGHQHVLRIFVHWPQTDGRPPQPKQHPHATSNQTKPTQLPSPIP